MIGSAKWLVAVGAFSGMLAVLFGAFGAHALRERLGADLMAVYHTGNQYHFYHSLGLILVGLVALQLPASALVRWSGWTMLAGLLIFSGSLYLLSLTGVRWLGAITPIGGTAFIVAWALLALAVLRA